MHRTERKGWSEPRARVEFTYCACAVVYRKIRNIQESKRGKTSKAGEIEGKYMRQREGIGKKRDPKKKGRMRKAPNKYIRNDPSGVEGWKTFFVWIVG